MKIATLATLAASVAASPIEVDVNGGTRNMYMVGSGSSAGASGYTLHHNSGVKLVQKDGMDPNQFFKPDLLGGSIEYDIGLKDVDCRCNAAFYMVSSPASPTACAACGPQGRRCRSTRTRRLWSGRPSGENLWSLDEIIGSISGSLWSTACSSLSSVSVCNLARFCL